MLQTNGMQRYIAIVLGFSPPNAQLAQRHGATSLRCVHDWWGGEAGCGVPAESKGKGIQRSPVILIFVSFLLNCFALPYMQHNFTRSEDVLLKRLNNHTFGDLVRPKCIV